MTRASIECRRQIPEIIEYLRKNWYGCENIYLIDSGNEALPMSLYKLVGRRPVCVNDMLNGVVPEDTIALCGYGIDVHSAEKGGQNYLHYLEPGQYYGIGYGALFPQARSRTSDRREIGFLRIRRRGGDHGDGAQHGDRRGGRNGQRAQHL